MTIHRRQSHGVQRGGGGDAVRLHGLTRRYGDKVALSVDDLTIVDGEFVCLIGRSGSGKSTLLRALAGLDNDVAGTGSVTVPEKRSVLFQDSRLLPWASVIDNVTLGLRGAVRPHRRRRVAGRRRPGRARGRLPEPAVRG